MANRDIRGETGTSAPVKTGLPQSSRRELAGAVAKSMAETYVLYTKTQAIHWNVVGPMFYALHKLTEEQYEDLADAIDDLASASFSRCQTSTRHASGRPPSRP
jgi:starvation-inducible DNA-binding protein